MLQLRQSSPANVQSQILTIRPRRRLRPIIFFGLCFALLAVVAYFKPQPYRAVYGGLAALATLGMIVQFRRESALIRNRLSATAVVVDHLVRGKHAPYFGGGVPIMKYEFLAFDQKTYYGETGWGAAALTKGSHITVLYDPENPARSHPLGGFVFFSFIE
jgi:hypothetical protein